MMVCTLKEIRNETLVDRVNRRFQGPIQRLALRPRPENRASRHMDQIRLGRGPCHGPVDALDVEKD
jgi:hypothetical protein